MGLKFRKSVKIAPGVRLNFGKKSTSVSFGGKGARYTVSSTGRKTASVGIPGTVGGKNKRKDKSNMSALKTKKAATAKPDKPKKPITKKWWFWTVLVGIVFSLATGCDTNTTEDPTPQQAQEENLEDLTEVDSAPVTEDTIEDITEVVAENTTTEEETEVPEPVTEEETEVPVEEPKTEEPAVETPAVVAPTPEAPVAEEKAVEKTYVLNTNTMKFHKEGCGSVKDIKDHNKGSFTGNRDDLIGKGYAPCGRCHP